MMRADGAIVAAVVDPDARETGQPAFAFR